MQPWDGYNVAVQDIAHNRTCSTERQMAPTLPRGVAALLGGNCRPSPAVIISATTTRVAQRVSGNLTNCAIPAWPEKKRAFESAV